jgi:hypothetical protein
MYIFLTCFLTPCTKEHMKIVAPCTKEHMKIHLYFLTFLFLSLPTCMCTKFKRCYQVKMVIEI